MAIAAARHARDANKQAQRAQPPLPPALGCLRGWPAPRSTVATAIHSRLIAQLCRIRLRRHQGREEPEQKKRTQAKNQNKKDRTRGSVFCLWRSAQRQTADGRRATHGGQTPTTHQKAVGALGNWTHLTGCIITSHTPYQQQKRPEIRSLPSFPPFSAP